MGLTRVELVTSRLSGVRSNRLSYRPGAMAEQQAELATRPGFYIRSLLVEKRREERATYCQDDTQKLRRLYTKPGDLCQNESSLIWLKNLNQ